ncbi:Fic family protein [Succinimonas sp.]|uniref:Fic family protein n=1 Tax=Succinimonas sp. TaxID=1936151 RepID=UPI00386DEDE6
MLRSLCAGLRNSTFRSLRGSMYIYDNQEWPNFRWDEHELAKPLFEIAFLMGSILGKMNSLNFAFQKEVVLESMTDEIVNSSMIEGVQLNYQEARSSVARKFDISSVPQTKSSRYVDGIVEMMMDARCNYDAELTLERLCGWQAAFFPGAFNGRYRIKTGALRDDKLGPMQVVSSAHGRYKVHFQAPDAERLPSLMNEFLKWIARSSGNPLIRAALAHLWFVIIHPFEDGNGRVARAITELMLARADKSPFRFYSISRQIAKNKKEYYLMLERAGRGDLDITAWLLWFLKTLGESLQESLKLIDKTVIKALAWQKYNSVALDDNQKKIVNMLLDGFEGKLTSGKWAKICKCSQDTATRAINYLLKNNILVRLGDGRSTHYVLKIMNDEKENSTEEK